MTDFQNWPDTIQCAITVSDKEGHILYMNQRSLATFCKDGESMVGQNMMPCHRAASQQKILSMLADGHTNAYTISKNGVKKLIFQSPWRDEKGEIAGMVELSIPLPEDMPHYQR